MYKLLRSFLFLFDPEKVHYFSMDILKVLCSIGFIKKIITGLFQPKENIQHSLFNIEFKNKVGLGAGFDKNASYLKELETLGFGFVEIGTVTPLPQGGNDKPRVFRLPADKALINRMGFNNDGVKAVAQKLKKWRDHHPSEVESGESVDSQHTNRSCQLVIGGNIGKNKFTPNEDAWKDYEICFNTLHPFVDYFVVNVSSPNTPGLRELQEKESLKKILNNLQMQNKNHINPKPILLKIAPDLSQDQLDDVINLAQEIKLDGLVATNTTISRSQLSTSDSEINMIGAGGLSGMPVQKRSTEIIHYIHRKTNGQIPIIASGGIFTAADAQEKLHAGASLVQVWTGFIYEGPAIVKNICKGIL